MDPGDSSRATEKTVEPVQASPVVPENKRFCRNCGAKVGRGHGGTPGLVHGFCSNCGAPFSFEAKLRVTYELVAGRYEVVGSLTGATYLARDREIERTVVVRDVIDAATTRDILTGIEHPNIIEVYDIVDPGYLVTEYVGGATLRELAGQLPLPRVVTYGLEILSALGYLHDRGLLHTDLRPEHIIVVQDHVKLDLGAVRRVDDDESPLWISHYSAPELVKQSASVASDLYSVGALLAMLSSDPAIDGFVQRATHANPDLRFASAGEMAEALAEVLAEAPENTTSGWHVFVEGMAEALAVAPPRRRRPRRSAWDRIETRLRDAYRELGPPEPGKGGHR